MQFSSSWGSSPIDTLDNWRNPQKQPGDRSQFVRFARVSAEIEEARKNGLLEVGPASISGYQRAYPVLFGLVALDELRTCLSRSTVKPHRREEAMRSVEATRCQLSLPILSCNISDPLPQLTGELQSIQSEQINFQNAVCLSGSEVIDAALAQQEDLYRTGGRMAEDYVAVAIIPRLKNGGKVVSKAYAIPDKVLREGTLAEKLQEQLSFHRLPKGELMTKRTVLANMDHLEFGLSLPGEAIVFEVSRCKLLAKELSMGGMLNSERLIEFVMSRLAGAQVKNVFEVIEEAQIQNLLDSDDKGVLFLPDPTEEELCAMAESCYFMPNAMLGLRDMLPKEALMWSLKDFSA